MDTTKKQEAIFRETYSEIIYPQRAVKENTYGDQSEENTVAQEAQLAYNYVTREKRYPAILSVKDVEFRVLYSDFDKIDSVRHGVSFKKFKTIFDLLNFQNTKWAEILGVSLRSIQSLLKEKKDLDQGKAEKFMSFLTLMDYGIEVLGSVSNFKLWLNYQAPALEGKCGLDFLDTVQGVNLLKETLSKVESGNLA